MIVSQREKYNMLQIFYKQKKICLNQSNFCCFKHSILLLYGQQNYLISTILLIEPKIWLVQSNILVDFDKFNQKI